MTDRDILGIIPARWASSRFPGKPLADMGGEPMVWRVYCRAHEALGSGNVVVATDDERIAVAVSSRGGRAVLTDGDIDSGTARCCRALEILGVSPEVVINIQGDEPFIDSDDLKRLSAVFDDPSVDIATLARHFDPSEGIGTLVSPNNPKVVTDVCGNALYFSRSVLPYNRDAALPEWTSGIDYLLHVGTYAFRCDVLRRLVSLPETALERAERLEQLRWLANGMKIRVVMTENQSAGIDTPEELAAALEKHGF